MTLDEWQKKYTGTKSSGGGAKPSATGASTTESKPAQKSKLEEWQDRFLTNKPQSNPPAATKPADKKTKPARKPGEIQALGAGDYGADKETRVDNVLKAAFTGSGAGFAKTASLLSGGTGELTMGQSAQAAVKGQNQQELETKKKASQAKIKEKLDATANKLQDKYEQNYNEAVDGLGFWGKLAVDAGVNITQMGLDALTGPASLLTMATRAGGSRALELEKQGYNENQQLVGGFTSGLIEALTEKIAGPFEKIYGKTLAGGAVSKLITKWGNSVLGRTALKFAANAAGEGFEEVLSDALNPIVDKLTGLNENDWDSVYADEDFEQWAYDFLVGSAIGGLGTGGQVISTAQENAKLKDTYGANARDLIAEGLESEEGTRSRELAEKFQQRLDAGKQLRGGQISQMLQANEDAFMAEDRASIKNAVQQRLVELGETADTESLSDIITKSISGERLSRSERAAIAGSKYGTRVINEASAENIESGEYASDWTKGINTSRINADVYGAAAEEDVFPAPSKQTAPAQPRATIPEGMSTAPAKPAQTPTKAPATPAAKTIAQVKEPITTGEVTGEVTGIKFNKGKIGVNVKTESGEIKNISPDDENLSPGTRALISYASHYGEAAPMMYAAYEAGQDVERYAQAWEVAYSLYGLNGGKFEALQKSRVASYLSPKQLQFAYECGEAARKSKPQHTEKGKKETVKSGTVSTMGGRVNGVELRAVDEGALTDKQRASIDAIEQLAGATGIDFILFESKADSEGRYTDANGIYTDGKIYIDVNAGMSSLTMGQNAMLLTAAHELTHYIKDNSPGKYEALKTFMFDKLSDFRGKSLEDMAYEKMSRSGDVLSMEEAVDEIVADGCEMMLQDSTAIQELAQEDKSLFDTIKEWITSWIENIKKAFAGVKAQSAEAKAMLEYADELQKLWDDALQDAVTSETSTTGGTKNSYAGRWANKANSETLSQAEQMEKQGASKEEIRQKTGWFRGMDEMWRFEIDDSGMEYDATGNFEGAAEKKKANADHRAAWDKLLNEATDEELSLVRAYNRAELDQDTSEAVQISTKIHKTGIAELFDDYINAVHRARMARGSSDGGKLSDYIKHTALFANYPQLRRTNLVFEKMGEGTRGFFDAGTNSIHISETLQNAPEETLIHEIQHVIQSMEGFAKGASPEFWESVQRSDNPVTSSTYKIKKSKKIIDEIKSLVPADVFKTFEDISESEGTPGEYDRLYASIPVEYLEAFEDYFMAQWNLEDAERYNLKRGEYDLYLNTAGEIEARDVSARLRYSEEERKNISPQKANLDTVFAEESAEDAGYYSADNSKAKYSLRSNEATDREVLAGLDEDLCENDTERGLLADYKLKFSEYSRILNDAASERAKVDDDATPQDEKKKARNRISTLARKASKAESELNKMEANKRLQKLIARGRESMSAVPAEASAETNRQLKAENENLRQRLKYWQRMAQRPDKPGVRKEDVHKLAGSILKEFTSDADRGVVESQITALGEYMVRNGYDGEGISFSEVKRLARNTAKYIVEESYTLIDDSMETERKELASYLRGRKFSLPRGYEADIQEYNEFRKKNFGRFTISKDGVPIDVAYMELQEAFGRGYFPDDIIHPAEMLERVSEVLDGMRPAYGNPFKNYMGETTELVANQIIDGLMEDVRQTAPTYADQLIKSHVSEVAKLREQNRERIAKVREEGRARMEEAVSRERERRYADIEGLKEHYHSKTERQRLTKSIEKKVKRLSDMAIQNTDKKHIPEALKTPLMEFLTTIDLSSRSKLNGGEETIFDREYTDRLDRLRQVLSNQKAAMEEGTDDYLGAYIDLPDGFTAAMESHKNDILQALNDAGKGPRVLGKMHNVRLQNLDRILTILSTSITKMNELQATSRYESVQKAAASTINDLMTLGESNQFRKGAQSVNDFLTWKNTLPFYAFKKLGGAGSTIFEGMMNGWDKLAFNTKAVTDYAESVYTAEQVKEWSKKTHTVKLHAAETLEVTDEGKLEARAAEEQPEVTLTVAQIMSIYCLSKREQALGHMVGGGIKIAAESKSGLKVKKQSEHYRLDYEDIKNIIGLLTEDQLEVAKKLQKYMEEQGSRWGNEISMARFGYRAFTERNYFPIKTDSNNRAAVDENAKNNDLYRLLNISATKPLTYNANNSIIVSSIFDVFAEHMADMAKYNALALPILDMMKWYNFKATAEGGKAVSVQDAVETAYGKAGKDYIVTFMKDLNGVQSSGRMGFASKAISNAKVAAVGANLRVALLQPTAYVRASHVIKGKYLTKAAAKGSAFKEMLQYSGIALWKDMGGFDTDVGRDIRASIKHEDKFFDKVKEKSMWGAEWGDKLTWGVLWNACKLEVKEQQKLEGEELLQATAVRFREVVYQTQVVDSTMTRSHLMRESGPLAGMVTSYMSEPTVTFNILLDAEQQLHAEARKTGNLTTALKKTSGILYKAMLTHIISATACAIIESIADALRDDDDYETFLQKWLEAMTGGEDGFIMGNLGQDLLISNKLPIARDVWSTIQGYANDNMSLQWMEQIMKVFKIWKESIQLANGIMAEPTDVTYKGKMTLGGKIYESLKALAYTTGIPLGSAFREVKTIWNNSISKILGVKKIKTYDAGEKSNIKYAYLDGYLSEAEAIDMLIKAGEASNRNDAWFMLQDGSKYDSIYKAIDSGNTADFNAAMKVLASHGVDKDTAQGAAKSYIKKSLIEDGTITSAEAKRRLTQFAGKTADEAKAYVDGWMFADEHPDLSWSDTQVSKYLSEVKQVGISVAVYDDYLTKLKSCKGIDADGDGKTDSGSKKVQVLEAINSLSVSYEQKDFLYYQEGYAESKIYEAPWHN